MNFQPGYFHAQSSAGHHGLAGVAALIGFLLVLGALIWLAVEVRHLRRAQTEMSTSAHEVPQKNDSARVILDERFARGEIDEGEYRWRRGLLSGDQ